MATEAIRVTAIIPAQAQRIYAAWLDGAEHARMTGGAANVDARVGGKHSAWDGYIEGEIVALEPGRRIVQTWRTSEFSSSDPHSQLEILLEPEGEHTRVVIVHTELPEGQGERYEGGWHDHYFGPMTAYFAEASEIEEEAPRTVRADPVKLAELTRPKAEKKDTAKKKAATKKVPAKKSAKKAPPKKSAPAKKAATKKVAAKKAPAKKTAAKKASAKKAAPAKSAAKKRSTKKAPAKKAASKKTTAKKASKRR